MLFRSQTEPTAVLEHISIRLLNILLEPTQSTQESGNRKVQQTIYIFFYNNTKSEKFFAKINYLIENEIKSINHYNKTPGQKQSTELIKQILITL